MFNQNWQADCNTKGGNCGYISTETRRQAIDVSSKSERSFNISITKTHPIGITTLSYSFLFILRAILFKKNIECMLAHKTIRTIFVEIHSNNLLLKLHLFL